MPTINEVLRNFATAKVFTFLDAKDGFFQVKLDEESSYLTTFWTPLVVTVIFGCIKVFSAPEEFQRRQNEVLAGLDGVVIIVDDILCYEEATEDHNKNLIKLLDRAGDVNLRLNKKKFRLRHTELPYMGQVLTQHGLKPDPSKISVILQMHKPENKKGVQRLLGCVN